MCIRQSKEPTISYSYYSTSKFANSDLVDSFLNHREHCNIKQLKLEESAVNLSNCYILMDKATYGTQLPSLHLV